MPFPPSASGPRIARAFQTWVAVVFGVAFASLGMQVEVLMGARGLLPAASALAQADGGWLERWLSAPTFLWWGATSPWLWGGILLGLGSSSLAVFGILARPLLFLCSFLYLSYIHPGQDFFSFQWDSLLVECGFLASLLRRDAGDRWVHFLLRFVLYKLYFESGIAKLESATGDWLEGSAMASYYQTAPLPTFLSSYAHSLPTSWHRLESWATLALELLVPAFVFGPRPFRLFALFSLTAFQVMNLLTANYGFFVYLTLGLHLFLLDEEDLQRLRRWGRERMRIRGVPNEPSDLSVLLPLPSPWTRLRGALVAGLLVPIHLLASGVNAWQQFGPENPVMDGIAGVLSPMQSWRLANSYHLFGTVTTRRLEVDFQTDDGGGWTSQRLRFKPGDPLRPPPFIAPYHPRVDFQAWFFPLRLSEGAPQWVETLVRRLCQDPAAVQPLFASPLPHSPEAVRLVFAEYRFTDASTRARTGTWWTVREAGSTDPIPCRVESTPSALEPP